MKTIIAATTNAHKIREISAITEQHGYRIISRAEAGIPSDFDVEENGATFEENSFLKAEAIFLLTGQPVIADDSGLEVDALKGAPGVYSARFADLCKDAGDFVRGESEDTSASRSSQDKANNAKLLRLLDGVPDEKRTARYVAAITLLAAKREPVVCRGEIEGRIGTQLRGENGFGYDPLFIPEGYSVPFGLIDAEVKNGISHRFRALEKLKEALPSL
jgi:XTP/dITP diphosphohydrolase